MKRCPTCGRDYNDDSLSFCLDDGSELLFGKATDEPRTAILIPPLRGPSSEEATRKQIADAEPPKSLGGLSERQSLSPHRAAQPQDSTTNRGGEQQESATSRGPGQQESGANHPSVNWRARPKILFG